MKREKLLMCEKCLHFIQHYSINRIGGVFKVFCGHCTERQLSKKECSKFQECPTSHDSENIYEVVSKVYRL